tara:strand:+ start:5333 stop:5791 length:459 start_codon:yes stop_codon:yes gene_type:complete
MGYFQKRSEQIIKTDIDTLWDFISDPSNLKKITPSKLGFKMIHSSNSTMCEGMIIGYKITPFLNIQTKWVTEISHLKHKEVFVDVQLYGPYKLWHHQHLFKAIDDNNVSMTDIVTYALPLGIIGDLVNYIFIEKKINTIFEFRKIALEKIFQ